tara:strand:- start:2572 stop:4518 length:1947 start_codon:yes stop_codon:yes gene_type:complete
MQGENIQEENISIKGREVDDVYEILQSRLSPVQVEELTIKLNNDDNTYQNSSQKSKTEPEKDYKKLLNQAIGRGHYEDAIVTRNIRVWISERIIESYLQSEILEYDSIVERLIESAKNGDLFNQETNDADGEILCTAINDDSFYSLWQIMCEKYQGFSEKDKKGSVFAYLLLNHKMPEKRKNQPVDLFDDLYDTVYGSKAVQQQSSDIELYLGKIILEHFRDASIRSLRKDVATLLGKKSAGATLVDLKSNTNIESYQSDLTQKLKDSPEELDKLITRVASILRPGEPMTTKLRKELSKDVQNIIIACKQDEYNFKGRINLAKRLSTETNLFNDIKNPFEIFESDELGLLNEESYVTLEKEINKLISIKSKKEKQKITIDKKIDKLQKTLEGPGQLLPDDIKNKNDQIESLKNIKDMIIATEDIFEGLGYMVQTTKAQSKKTTGQLLISHQTQQRTQEQVQEGFKLGKWSRIGILSVLLALTSAVAHFTGTTDKIFDQFKKQSVIPLEQTIKDQRGSLTHLGAFVEVKKDEVVDLKIESEKKDVVIKKKDVEKKVVEAEKKTVEAQKKVVETEKKIVETESEKKTEEINALGIKVDTQKQVIVETTQQKEKAEKQAIQSEKKADVYDQNMTELEKQLKILLDKKSKRK